MSPDRRHTVVASPIGPLTAVASAAGLCGLYTDRQKYLPARVALGPRDDGVLPGLLAQLAGYFLGERQRFDLPLDLGGTPFQTAVWQALLAIPYGQTRTYAELAELLGRPTAARAVGAANGRNPVSIVVPCHRLVGRAGDLTGYAGGVERKRFLLDLERPPPERTKTMA